MVDVVYIGLFVAFFGLAALLVRGCEAILGPDEQAAPQRESEPERLAA